jgi:hypothetical protein
MVGTGSCANLIVGHPMSQSGVHKERAIPSQRPARMLLGSSWVQGRECSDRPAIIPPHEFRK